MFPPIYSKIIFEQIGIYCLPDSVLLWERKLEEKSFRTQVILWQISYRWCPDVAESQKKRGKQCWMMFCWAVEAQENVQRCIQSSKEQWTLNSKRYIAMTYRWKKMLLTCWMYFCSSLFIPHRRVSYSTCRIIYEGRKSVPTSTARRVLPLSN